MNIQPEMQAAIDNVRNILKTQGMDAANAAFLELQKDFKLTVGETAMVRYQIIKAE